MTQAPSRTNALIVAAGVGQRMGGEIPKQYRQLAGKSVLRRSVEAFTNHPLVDAVCVAIHPSHESLCREALAGLPVMLVHGGATRQASVRNGTQYLMQNHPADNVLVHDAARCFIDAATITHVIEGLQDAQAVIPTLPVSDTLKTVADSHVQQTVPRERLHAVQTPQGFNLKCLHDLHLNASSESATDDAALAEAAGINVRCVAGSGHNFKITTAEDWQRAEMYAHASYIPRTGMGYDVHRLIPQQGERRLQICGVTIPHDFVLEGHSDADVGLHALVDAILGALALGDIGSHFPPSDAKWKGADSALFVTYCREQLQERGALLTHVDITLICEAPKIAPHRAAMQQRVAELLGIETDCVSVKATTSEGLGFTGRREGIAAQAVATLQLPPKGAQ